MASLVTFDRATLGYGRRAVLTDISFEIPDGDFLGLVGPNGAGKTTILRALLGTLEPLGGTVSRAPTLRFGYVPQRDQVDYSFPLKVLDVVMMGRYDRIGLGRRPTEEDRRRAHQALEHAPEFQADPARHGTRSSTFIVLNFAKRMILIGGTRYAGELKKAMFTVMNYYLPKQGVLSMRRGLRSAADARRLD